MRYSFNHDRRKWIATLVASAFFIYFWTFGPLQAAIEPFFESEKDAHYVKPVVISEDKAANHFSSKSIGEFETEGDGYRLITNSEKEAENAKVLAFDDQVISNTEYGRTLLKNARHFFKNPLAQFTLKQTEQLFYAEVQLDNERFFYFQSKGLTNHIKGYSGPINIGIFIDENARLKNIHLVSSSETKSYLEKIAKTHYYDQYNNQPINKTHQIDAISGATITTKAIALTTTELVSTAYPQPIEILSDKMGISDYMVNAKLTLWWILEIGLIFILFLYAYQKKLRKSKRFVILTSLASMLYIGFFLNESFTYVTFIHPFIGTSLSSFMGLYALFVLLGAIWGKNTYCKHICPYGNIQRLQLKLTKGLNKKFFLKNKRIRQVRFTILFFLIVGIVAGLRNLSHLEPFPYIFGLEIESLWYFVFAVFGLLINWIYPMIWCRLLCPTGSILDTITVLSTKK